MQGGPLQSGAKQLLTMVQEQLAQQQGQQPPPPQQQAQQQPPPQQAGCGDPMAQQQQVDVEQELLSQLDMPVQDDILVEDEIQMDSPSMDVGEIGLEPQDEEILGTLFASNPEVQQAKQAQALETGVPQTPAAPMTRTASTRTVGTQPTGGVAALGAAPASAPASTETDKLSGLWNSAPDVSDAFR